MIKFQKDGANLGIDFEYKVRNYPLYRQEGRKRIKTLVPVVVTRALVFNMDSFINKVKKRREEMYSAEVFCPTDVQGLYNKPNGRRRALQKLLTTVRGSYFGRIFDSKELRTQIWDTYFDLCHDLPKKVKTIVAAPPVVAPKVEEQPVDLSLETIPV